MSHIDDLIAEKCPAGVEFKLLQEVCRIRNGKDYKKFAAGSVPVFGTGGIMAYVDTSVYDKPSVLIPRKGSLSSLYFVDHPFWTVDTIFYTEIFDHLMAPKFLYYFLATQHLEELNQASGVPSLTQSMLNKLRIPVPHLDIQHEIVRVLDTLTHLATELDAELDAELEARRIQYEYYRDSLLTFAENGVRRAILSEIGTLYGGLTGKAKADFGGGNDFYVSYMNVFSNIETDVTPRDLVAIKEGERQNRIHYGDVLFTSSSESPGEVGISSCVTTEPQGSLYLNSFCFGFRPYDPELLTPDFAKHLFRSAGLRQQIVKTANGVTRFNISKDEFRKIEVPIPEIDDQARIAGLLDKFEALVNDLSVGLPAELTARRKQYEFYRDRLLTFDDVVI